MSFSIELTLEAELDIEKFKKSGDKKSLVKIDKLLNELREHPTTGTGKPEN
jgi:toxin YoeB